MEDTKERNKNKKKYTHQQNYTGTKRVKNFIFILEESLDSPYYAVSSAYQERKRKKEENRKRSF
jgi:hypothetical protein